MAMIECKDVSKWYGSFQVLTNCSTTVEKGEVIVVCGPSGSGKSTLIKCVNALEPFQKGVITVDGVSVGAPKTNLPKLRARVASELKTTFASRYTKEVSLAGALSLEAIAAYGKRATGEKFLINPNA